MKKALLTLLLFLLLGTTFVISPLAVYIDVFTATSLWHGAWRVVEDVALMVASFLMAVEIWAILQET